MLPLILSLLAFVGPQPYEDRTFQSRVFGQARTYRLFLPSAYAGGQQRYPVIYYFHGHSDRYTLERYDEGKDTVPKIAAFVAANPVIVVAVDGYVAEHYTGFYGGAPYDAMQDGGTYDFGEYFKELVAHIDSTLRIIPGRRYRATSGLSMGGFTSVFLSARYPDLVGSASAFNPSPELFAGEKGRRSLWRTRDQVENHEASMVRLVRASGDYISQYHEELRAAYAANPRVAFEFRQDEYHRHWATSIAETFAFHRAAFANASLDTLPEEWTYTSAYRSFQIRGYRVDLESAAPALITLSNVRQGSFTVATRQWAPDGPSAQCSTLRISTAPVYRAGQPYQVLDLPLSGGPARKSELTATADGRLNVSTDCSGHVFSFSGPGTGAEPPLMLPWTTRDYWRVRPGEELQPPIRIYNPRAKALENVKVELTSDYPTVEILSGPATVPRIEPGSVADLQSSFRVRFTAGSGDFARTRLRLKVTYDGYIERSENIDVMVAPSTLGPPVEMVVLDGRTHTFPCFRQKGNQGGGSTVERTVTEGKGNGNGILEPGEEATVWVRLKQGLDPFDKDNWHRAKVYSESPLVTEVADIQEEKQREWTGVRNRTSVIRLSPAATGKIRLILDRESWSFHFTPDVRYGVEPLYQAFQLHQHHLFDWTLEVGANAQHAAVEGVVLSNDAWPRATTLREWTADVMRISGKEKASETAQGKAFFEWLRLFSRMAVGGMIQSYEGPRGKEAYVLDAHKQLFVYGWGYCDTTSRIAEAAWQEYKRDARSAERVITQHEDGGYHTMYRLRMDGRYGAFDPRYGYYLLDRDAPDARVLDWAELNRKFETNRSYANRSRPFFEIAGVEWQRALLLKTAWFDTEDQWRDAGAPKETVFGDGAYQMGTAFHDMTFTLLPGMKITRYWSNSARKFYVPAGEHTKREWPFLPSGRFYRVTDKSHGGNWPKNDPNYERIKPYLTTVPPGEGYPAELEGGRAIGQAYGVIEYEGNAPLDIRSPFVLVDGTLEGESIQTRTLAPKPRNAAEPDEWSDWQTGRNLDIQGKYRFQVRAASGSHVKLKIYFENGIMSIPPLLPGRNTVRLRLKDPQALGRPIEIVYRYTTADGDRTHRQVLQTRDFHGSEATYQVDAPGLLRCESVSISY